MRKVSRMTALFDGVTITWTEKIWETDINVAQTKELGGKFLTCSKT